MGKSSFSREVVVETGNLRTAKVEGVEKFGGLTYANIDFHSFVERLEFAYKHTLTPELLVMNGSYLIKLVYTALNIHEHLLMILSNFYDDNASFGDNSSHIKIYNTGILLDMRQEIYSTISDKRY